MITEAKAFMNTVGDTLSISVLIGYFASALPSVATLVTIVWGVIRIYETETVQKWIGKRNEPLS